MLTFNSQYQLTFNLKQNDNIDVKENIVKSRIINN